MAGIQDFVEYCEDFLGPQTLTASPTNSDQWDITDTSAAGTPTYTVGGIGGEATITLDATNEVENVCLFKSDVLNYDIDNLVRIEMRVKIGASTFTSGSTLVFGLGSARNDTPDSVAANAWFRMEGANSTTLVYCETDDGVTDNDDKSSGVTLGTTYKRFVIDFTGGKSDVKFYIDGTPVATATTFDMSGYSVGLQPIVQLQKAANTNADSVVVDYIKIVSRRA